MAIIIICLITRAEEVMRPIRVAAAFDSCLIFAKLYDWLRLFESTSFYILLITQTIDDITAFITIFLISLLMFGIPMVMLNMNRPDPDAIDEIPEKISSALAAFNPNIDEGLGD